MMTFVPRGVAVWLMAGLISVGCSSVRHEARTQGLRVETNPAGAQVWIQDEGGQRVVGTSPTDLEGKHEVGIFEFSYLDWIWTIGTVGAGTAGLVGMFTIEDDTGAIFAGIGGFSAGLVGLGLLVGSIWGPFRDGSQVATYSTKLTVGAHMGGYLPASMEVFFPKDVDTQVPVVAVFQLHDNSGRLTEQERGQLTDVLATRLTELGKARVVPREQIRKRLLDEKYQTYKQCYQESCQIELGRAVAAEKSLSSAVMRVGSKCTVVANLYDLKSETAVKGTSVESACTLADLMTAVRQVAEKL